MTRILTEPDVSEETKLAPFWHVILLNDDDHTFEYVIEMLGKIFGYGRWKGFRMAWEVHTRGRVILATLAKEHAEVKQEQIHAHGKDWRIPRCAGSMSAALEPAEG